MGGLLLSVSTDVQIRYAEEWRIQMEDFRKREEQTLAKHHLQIHALKVQFANQASSQATLVIAFLPPIFQVLGGFLLLLKCLESKHESTWSRSRDESSVRQRRP